MYQVKFHNWLKRADNEQGIKTLYNLFVQETFYTALLVTPPQNKKNLAFQVVLLKGKFYPEECFMHNFFLKIMNKDQVKKLQTDSSFLVINGNIAQTMMIFKILGTPRDVDFSSCGEKKWQMHGKCTLILPILNT